MRSVALSMISRPVFDIEYRYGSAVLFEGALLEAIRGAGRRGGLKTVG